MFCNCHEIEKLEKLERSPQAKWQSKSRAKGQKIHHSIQWLSDSQFKQPYLYFLRILYTVLTDIDHCISYEIRMLSYLTLQVLGKEKLNPLHLHCVGVFAAYYPLTEDYDHFASHFRVLKPPPDPQMQASTAIITVNTAVIMKPFIYLALLEC